MSFGSATPRHSTTRHPLVKYQDMCSLGACLAHFYDQSDLMNKSVFITKTSFITLIIVWIHPEQEEQEQQPRTFFVFVVCVSLLPVHKKKQLMQ